MDLVLPAFQACTDFLCEPGSQSPPNPTFQPGPAPQSKCGPSLTSLPPSSRISALTASLHAHSRKKTKRKHPRRAQDSTKKPPSATRTSKGQRRRLTGKARHNGE